LPDSLSTPRLLPNSTRSTLSSLLIKHTSSPCWHPPFPTVFTTSSTAMPTEARSMAARLTSLTLSLWLALTVNPCIALAVLSRPSLVAVSTRPTFLPVPQCPLPAARTRTFLLLDSTSSPRRPELKQPRRRSLNSSSNSAGPRSAPEPSPRTSASLDRLGTVMARRRDRTPSGTKASRRPPNTLAQRVRFSFN
ncbi:hypothetical protein GGR52DRAFT_175261, partial [Hypoxylon sp. FL1284]